jgi:O-antigen/teichoic acid export membrane protein
MPEGQAEPTQTTHGTSIAGGSVRLLVARALVSVAGFVSVLILARALPPQGRGAVAFVMMTGLVLAGISRVGLDEATTVFAARRTGDRPRLVSNLLLFSLAMATLAGGACAVVLAAAPSIRPDGIDSAELIALLYGTIGLGLSGAAVAILLGCGRFRDQAIAVSAAPLLLTIALVVVVVFSELSVRAACIAWAAAQVAGACVGCVAAVLAAGIGRPSGPLLRESLTFGVRAWMGSFAAFLNARVDQVIMGFISTEAALGFYAVAVNASEVVLYLPAAVAMVIVPSIARGVASESVATTLRIFRALFLLTAGVVAVGYACTPLVPLVFGGDYESSVEPYLVLLPGGLAYVALVVFSGSLLASSSPGRSSLGPFTALVLGVALDFALIPSLGATGAAIAATAAFAAGGAVAAAAYLRLTRVDARQLVPGRGDLQLIGGLVRRATGRAG